jgi:flagellar biogenesis protein FliO
MKTKRRRLAALSLLAKSHLALGLCLAFSWFVRRLGRAREVCPSAWRHH